MRAADPLAEALGLLAAFERSDWLDAHVRAGEFEFYVSRRTPGRTAPLPSPVPAERPSATEEITAPHVATVRHVRPAGEAAEAGEALVVLEILGELVELPAPVRCRIASASVVAGDLVEYGQLLIRFVAEGA
jgi:biotin carboxyl carrier protein